MNIITFLELAIPSGGYTTVTTEMRKFLTDRDARRALSKVIGMELARAIYDAAQPEIDRIIAIIDRVQVAIDYVISEKAFADYEQVLNEFASNDFFVTGEITDFVTKNKQKFAYDADQAFDITETILHFKDDDTVLFSAPFILHTNGVDPSLSFAWPDEGSAGGLASVLYVDQPNREPYQPKVGFHKFRYIYTRELSLNATEITKNIIDEVDRGATPLAGGGLPGWN